MTGTQLQTKRDQLTGLHIREWAIHRIDKIIRQKQPIWIALLDIDFFTIINEKLGWKTGDQVLVKIAELIRRYEPIEAARYGGDEFILFGLQREQDGFGLADEIRRKIRKEVFAQAEPFGRIPIKVSAGVAEVTDRVSKSLPLLKAAEIALAVAKKKGRNRTERTWKQTVQIQKRSKICTTILGMGLKGHSRDGTKAFSASIAEPYGVDIEENGDIVLADRSNHQIRRIHCGRIYTVAGCGVSGYSGDGAAAKQAYLSKPSGVAIGPNHCIYLADTGNHCIRKVQDGKIYTIAGCGEEGYSGDGGPAVNARLRRPGGVVTDDEGNVYTNDYGNNVIRMIDPSGIITTIAGCGQYGYSGDGGEAIAAKLDRPYGLAVDSRLQMLFIVDFGNHCIRGVDLRTKGITTLAGNGTPGYAGDGGPGVEAQLNGPFWAVCWKHAFLLIADGLNHCIRKLDLERGRITTLAGGSQAGYIDAESREKIRFTIPAGLAVQGDLVVVADYGNNAIRKVWVGAEAE